MEWMATVTGDRVGLLLDFSLRRKKFGNHFSGQKWIKAYKNHLQKFFEMPSYEGLG
jgi:hypothetical protein